MQMTKRRSSRKPLTGRVALVAGATRGAGRGIARALSEAGATVYCTGRSVKGRPSPYRRPETIDDTAAIITAAGGKAIAVRVDHTKEAEVKALFRRIMRAHARLDVVVDSVAGEDPLMGTYGFLWQADLEPAEAIVRQGLISRRMASRSWPSRPVSCDRNPCCSTSASPKRTGEKRAGRIRTSCEPAT
jgi:NAD(P)-dependent dehydrogenase (short-subunit alcohol dehydrogenase family)